MLYDKLHHVVDAFIVPNATIWRSMPQAGEDNTTPKKRAAKKRASSKRATTKRATRKTTSKTTTKTTTRKAPTASPSETSSKRSNKGTFMVVIVVALAAIGGASYAIGVSDTGQIDVSETISDRVALEIERGGESAAMKALNAQSQNRTPQRNGGLVGRGNKQTEQQKMEQKIVEETASTTATTTDATASSTSEVSPESEAEAEPAEETSEETNQAIESDTSETASTTDSEEEN